MNERDFFNEREEVKKAVYRCPHCRERGEYDVRWLKRTKKPQPPRGMNEQDRARFQKSRDDMVRNDDMFGFLKIRYRRRSAIASSQSVFFIGRKTRHPSDRSLALISCFLRKAKDQGGLALALSPAAGL